MVSKVIVQADLELFLPRVKRDRDLELSLSAKRKLWRIENDLVKFLSQYYDGFFVAYASDLASMLLTEIKNMSGPIYCLDDVIYHGIKRDMSRYDVNMLQVNRHYNLWTQKTSITARQGFSPYKEQIRLYKKSPGDNFVDSIYSGFTASQAFDDGLPFEYVHAPISTPLGIENLTNKGLTVNSFGYECDFLLCELRDTLIEGRPVLHDDVFISYFTDPAKFLGKHFPNDEDAIEMISRLSLNLRDLAGIARLPGPIITGIQTWYLKCSTRYIE
jgi:hypothetical protein